jgi:DNA-binding NtrC family response regulator
MTGARADMVSATARGEGADQRPGLLIVDDDPLIVESLTVLLEDEYQVSSAATRAAARALLRKLDPVPSLALVDLGLPPRPHAPEEGFALIGDLVAFNRAMKILVLSGQSAGPNVQHAFSLGAVDFVAKPCDARVLGARLRHQLAILEAEQALRRHPLQLLGDSSAMATLRGLIGQFANTPFPVLIEGESGSGKELVAQCLHADSARAASPYLAVNCAAFTAELLEAQLFGHAKGAFTGATGTRPGFFEDAAAGTLFLDEIGDFPLELQPKLLRVVESGEYYRVGETQPRRALARIIAATNRDLRADVRGHRFRQDLYHRLSVLTIRVPPLRERGSDRVLLLEAFQSQYAASVAPFTLAPAAVEALLAYSFPGNVRELRNIVIRLGAKHPGQVVTREQLLAECDTAEMNDSAVTGGEADALVARDLAGNGFNLDDSLREWERRYVEAAMRAADGNLSKAARALGVNRSTLYSRIERLKSGG